MVIWGLDICEVWMAVETVQNRAKTEQELPFPYIHFSFSSFEVFGPKLKNQARKSKLGGYRLSSSIEEDSNQLEVRNWP